MRRPGPAAIRTTTFAFACAAAASVTVASAGAAWAERAPFPTWQAGQRVYFSGTPELPALAPGLARLQQGSEAQLIVVMVDIADRGGVGRSGDGYSNAAGDYGDDLYEHWVEAGALNAGLDGRRHVLITHALDNRSIGVHWGSEWQALGYSEASGVGLIDRSDFVSNARAGMFAEANLALARQAVTELAAARERARTDAEKNQQRLRDLRAGLEAMQARSLASEPARVALTYVREHLARAEEALSRGDQRLASSELEGAQGRLDGARQAESSYRRNRFLKTRLLPISLGAVGLGLAVLFLLMALRRRRRWQARWSRVRGEWKARLAQGRDRLMGLEDGHPLFFRPTTNLASTLTGESLERYRAMGEIVDGLMLGIDAAGTLLTSAEAAASGTGPLGWRGFDEAVDMMRLGNVELSTKAKADRRRLFLPEPRVESIPVFELFSWLDERYGRAVDLLDALGAEWRSAPKAEQALAEALDRVVAAAGKLAARELPLAPYQAEIDRLAGERRAIEALLPRDFIGARKQAEAARTAATTLADQLELLATIAARVVDELTPAIAAEAARVTELRGKGLRVREPIFDPEARLADARALAGEALDAVRAGDVAASEAHLGDLEEVVEGTRQRLDATARLHTELPRLVAERRAALASARGRTAPARATLAELEKAYAHASFAAESDNLSECDALFTQLEALCSEAEQDGQAATQRYLAGDEKLGRAAAALTAIAELLDAIERRKADIEAAIAHARAELARARDARATLGKLAAGNPHAVGAGPVGVLESSEHALAEVDEAVATPRPEWFGLDQRASQLAAVLTDAVAVAQRDIDAHAAAEREVGDGAAVLERVRAELGASTVDRAPANARLAAATGELERARQLLAEPRGDWQLTLASARSAIALAGSAAELAARDEELARSAQVAMAAAQQATTAADRNYGRGVRADLVTARNAMTIAQDALQKQNYEVALYQAEVASSNAEASQRAAAAEVSRLQEREAAQQAAAAYAAELRRSRRSSWGSGSGSSFWSSSSSSSRSGGSSWSSSRSSSSSSRSSSSSSSSSRSYSSGSSSRSYSSGSSSRGY